MNDIVKNLEEKEKILVELLDEAKQLSATRKEHGEKIILKNMLIKKLNIIRRELIIRTCKPCPEYVNITKNEYNRNRRRDNVVEQFIVDYYDKLI